MGRKKQPQRGGWYRAVDGEWYQSERPPAPGWVVGTDGRWGPPPQRAAPQSKPLGDRAVPYILGAVTLAALVVVGLLASGIDRTTGGESTAAAGAPTTAPPPPPTTAPAPTTTLRPLTDDELWARRYTDRVYELERSVNLLGAAVNASDAYRTGEFMVDVQSKATSILELYPPKPVATYCTAALTLVGEARNAVVTSQYGAWNTIVDASNIAKNEVDQFLEFLRISIEKR